MNLIEVSVVEDQRKLEEVKKADQDISGGNECVQIPRQDGSTDTRDIATF